MKLLALLLLLCPSWALADQYKALWQHEPDGAAGFIFTQNDEIILDIPETGLREYVTTLGLTGYDAFWMRAYYPDGSTTDWWGAPCGGPFLIIDGEPQGDLTWPPLPCPGEPINDPEPEPEPTGRAAAPGQLKKSDDDGGDARIPPGQAKKN